MKYLVFFSMLVLSCATTNPADTAHNSGSTRSASSSLVAGKSWMLRFPSGCVLKGHDNVAERAECPKLGKMELSESVSKEYGAQVATLQMIGDDPFIGANPLAKLSHSGATYYIDDTSHFASEVKYELYKHRVAEREERLRGAEPCAEGEVVLQYDGCPDMGGPATVCGRPITTCGAPLKIGETCWFNASCESGDCSLSNVCQ